MKQSLVNHKSELSMNAHGQLGAEAGKNKLAMLLLGFWIANVSVFLWFFVRYGVLH